ncbi:hypothetical protein EmuJ_000006700 [Echinococcus multilocularis]|uniref:Uncharacterized protein n=1 Tax=Echinococcus multilocularis TaxID=6211 RepID=A0A087VWC6_ECHMU|nr:hypothetical protein EmuJ_000006700 [Echinococcus multilocularis]
MTDIKGPDESYFEEEAFSSLLQPVDSPSTSSNDTDRIPVVAVSLPVSSGSIDINCNCSYSLTICETKLIIDYQMTRKW